MIYVLTKVLFFITIILSIYNLYFGIMTCIGMLSRNKNMSGEFKNHKIAIVIPCRNEETVIGNLIDSLKKLNYPKNLYEIFVVINNSRDNTKDIAASKNVKIYECKSLIRNKGEALNEFFNYVLKSIGQYDAYCIFDADNIVSENFLREINIALCNGADVVQGYRDIKNPNDSIISMWYSIYYYISNRFYNTVRNNINLSAIINGSGFAVSYEFLKKQKGWNTETLTEDIEFTAKSILSGRKVAWAQNAVYYDEEPVTFAQSWRQRRRWMTGLIQCMELYSKKLLKNFVSERNLNSFDFFMFSINPIIQILCAISIVLIFAIGLLFQRHTGVFPGYYKTAVIMFFISVFGGAALISFLAVLFEKKTVLNIMEGIMSFGLFMLSWLPITVLSIANKKNSWDEIKHTRNIKLNDIVSTFSN